VAIDPVTDRAELTAFISRELRWYQKDEKLCFRLRRLDARLTRQNLLSRFNRYVLYANRDEWTDYKLDDDQQELLRPRQLAHALAGRTARNDRAFEELLPVLVSSATQFMGLFAFGQWLCEADQGFQRLEPLLTTQTKVETTQCLGGYFNRLKILAPGRWQTLLLRLLQQPDSAPLGAKLVWHSGFNDQVFSAWLSAYEKKYIIVDTFHCLCWGLQWQSIQPKLLGSFLQLLYLRLDEQSASLLIDLLDQTLKADSWPVGNHFIFQVVTAPIYFEKTQDQMRPYHWQQVSQKLIQHCPEKAPELLNVLLTRMQDEYSLSYDHNVEYLALEICKTNPVKAWHVVVHHLESALSPQWRWSVINWLSGGLGGFDEREPFVPIRLFPVELITAWIEEDPENRASLIACTAPKSLDDAEGGELTRFLIEKFGDFKGVKSGINARFHSGGWSGPTSQYLRRKRDRFRRWLGDSFHQRVATWIEEEIDHLDRAIEQAEIQEEREPWRRPANLDG